MSEFRECNSKKLGEGGRTVLTGETNLAYYFLILTPRRKLKKNSIETKKRRYKKKHFFIHDYRENTRESKSSILGKGRIKHIGDSIVAFSSIGNYVRKDNLDFHAYITTKTLLKSFNTFYKHNT